MMMKPAYAFIGSLCCLSLGAMDLPERERDAVRDALYAVNLTPADLSYPKGSLTDPYRLQVVHHLLHDPLAIPSEVERLCGPLRARDFKPSDRLRLMLTQLPDGREISLSDLQSARLSRSPTGIKNLPKEAHEPILRLAGAYWTAYQEREKAFAKLSRQERRLLIENLPWLAAEEPDLGFPITPELEKNPDLIWQMLEKVQWRALWRAELFRLKEVETAFEALAHSAKGWRGKVRIELPHGEQFIIAGDGHDVHTDEAVLIIDLGGDDLYSGKAAQAAIIVDGAGSDTYRADKIALGAGLLTVGVLWDRSGQDHYEASALTQGFGAFGAGILLDEEGNDTYRAQLFAQGSSRTWGVGLLADRSGNDIYQAGGRFIHKPLLEKEGATFSFAQGFSIGYRPNRSGGIGLLWDGAGDDTYTAGTYSQGASYWFSFGCLLDESGNDKYVAFYYSQASAMHLTVAALIDKAGYDVYTCHMGAIHAIGHDWGVALLWDAAGNDVYAGDSSPGVGVANGIGIFIDSGGNDRYMGTPGNANPARDTGSIGLFVDLGGQDQYGRGLEDEGTRLNNRWGVAMDRGSPAQNDGNAAEVNVPRHAVGSLPMPTEEEMEKLYTNACLWEVGTARETVRKARHQLIGIGMPAAKWMVDKKLALMDNLATRAFEEVLRETNQGVLLVEPLQSNDSRQVENALRLVTSLRVEAAGVEGLRLLKEAPRWQRLCIAAAGAIKLKEAVPVLLQIAGRADPFTQLAVALALGKIGDPAALQWLVSNLSSPDLPTREACADALVLMGEQAVPTLLTLGRDSNATVARLAMRSLGELKTIGAIPLLQERARDLDWGIRLSALQALKKMDTPEALKIYEDTLARETDQRVKTALKSL